MYCTSLNFQEATCSPDAIDAGNALLLLTEASQKMEEASSDLKGPTNKSSDVIIKAMETTLREEVSKFTRGSQNQGVNIANKSNIQAEVDRVVVQAESTELGNDSRRNWKVVILPEKKGLTKIRNQERTKHGESAGECERRSSRLAAKKIVEASMRSPLISKVDSESKDNLRATRKGNTKQTASIANMRQSTSEGIVHGQKESRNSLNFQSATVEKQVNIVKNNKPTQVVNSALDVQIMPSDGAVDSGREMVQTVDKRSESRIDSEIVIAVQQNARNTEGFLVGDSYVNVQSGQSPQEYETAGSQIIVESHAKQNDGIITHVNENPEEVHAYEIRVSSLTGLQ